MIETKISSDETIEELELGAAPATMRQRSWLILVAAVVILLDQASKYIIESALPLYRSWAPIPAIEKLFQITHVANTGTAFGLFPAGSSIFAWAAVLVSLAILGYNFTLPSGQRLLRFALGLQLGGALGNLIDRVRLGHVTDFLDFGPWPVFNVADLSIVTGAFVLAWFFWQDEKARMENEKSAAEQKDATIQRKDMAAKPGMVDEWSAN